jgi:hypothetical protein
VGNGVFDEGVLETIKKAMKPDVKPKIVQYPKALSTWSTAQ